MEKFGIKMLKETKPILSDLGTYLTKVSIVSYSLTLFLPALFIYHTIPGRPISN